MLRFVLRLAVRLADEYGCLGVLVDAQEDAVPFYETLGFMPLYVLEGESAMRPAPTAMFLSIVEIDAASRKRK